MEFPFILINTPDTGSYNNLLREYLSDQYKGPHLRAELRVNEILGLSAIVFSRPLDNLEFVRLFLYLSSDKDLKGTGYQGWFQLSERYHSKTTESENRHDYPRKGYAHTVTDEDSVVVYSDQGERIEFDVNGSYQASEQAEGYREPEVFPETFTLVETIESSSGWMQDQKKGCAGFACVLLLGILLFLL